VPDKKTQHSLPRQDFKFAHQYASKGYSMVGRRKVYYAHYKKTRNRLFFGLTIGLITLILAALMPLQTSYAQTNADSLNAETPTLSSTISGMPLVVSQDVIINFKLSGSRKICPAPPKTPVQHIDAVLVVDQTAALSRAHFDSAAFKTSLRGFVTALAPTLDTDHVGLVTAADTSAQFPLSPNTGSIPYVENGSTSAAPPSAVTVNDLQTQIDALNKAPLKDVPLALADAIHKGTLTVTDITTRGNANKTVLVLLIAATPNDRDAALREARAANIAGVQIVAIGLGSAVDKGFLTQLTGSDANVSMVPNVANLLSELQNRANALRTLKVANNVSIAFQRTDPGFEIIPTSVSSGGAASVDAIRWTPLGSVDDGEQIAVSFRVRALKMTTHSPGQFTVQYVPCAASTPNTLTVIVPPAVLLLPTNTPLPPPTQTPLPTPTPQSLAMPTLPIVPVTFHTDASTALTNGINFCAPMFDWIRWILLPIFLLLALLLWRVLRFAPLIHNGGLRLCSVVRLLGLEWGAAILWLMIWPVIGSVCPTQDSVYFWREDPTQTDKSGIYVTAFNQGADPAVVPFSSANEGRCVGCHVVSSTGSLLAGIEYHRPQPDQVVIFKLNGERVTIPTIQGNYLSFNPDGTKLAIGTWDLAINILDLKTMQLTPLAGASDPAVAQTMPSWGTNGQIAFVRVENKADAPEGGFWLMGASRIYSVPETGGTAQLIKGTDDPTRFNYYPSYSPDGKWLAFTSAHLDQGQQGTFANPDAKVYVVPAVGGNATLLTANATGASNSWPSWSRDGKVLSFSAKPANGNWGIFYTSFEPTSGQSGNAIALPGATQPGVFQHTAFWGVPITPTSFGPYVLNLLPWLLPTLGALLIAPFLCRPPTIDPEQDPIPLPPKRVEVVRPGALPPYSVPVLWEAQPTLLIGVGDSGRYILTHLKKNLIDASSGQWPKGVQMLSIATGNLRRKRTAARPLIEFAGVQLADAELLDLTQDLSELARRDLRTDASLREWFDGDKLRSAGVSNLQLAQSTGDQRTLARAGLIAHLRGQRAADESSLVDQLAQAVLACRSAEGTLYVVIVGSTADDGSGLLLDMAYLVRRAARLAGINSLNVTAHLATDGALSAGTNDPRILRVNSEATLRELERFQRLSQPVAQRYGVPELDGVVGAAPFDLLTLYDGQAANGGLGSMPPNEGVYPAIADAVALGLDKAARSGSWQDVQNRQRSTLIQAQAVEQQLMIRSLGTFQYRLPFMDLLGYLRQRYSAELLTVLVMGSSEGTHRLDLSADSTDFVLEAGESIAQLARDFFTLALPGAPRTALTPTWRVLTKRQEARAPDEARRALKRDPQSIELRQYLARTVERLLNGAGDNPDYVQARTRQLKRTRAFLEALGAQIEQVRSLLPDYGAALDALDGCRTRLQGALLAQADLLGASGARVDSLYGRFAQGIDLTTRRAELDKVVVRKLIWEGTDETGQMRALAEVWYNAYLFPTLSEHLGRFYWEANEDGVLQLTLSSVGQTVALSPDTLDTFAAALNDLSGEAGQHIREGESLAARLTDNVLAADQLDTTAQTLLRKAAPLLNYGTTNTQELHRVVLANQNIPQARELSTRLADLSTNMKSVIDVTSTDPFSLGVLGSAALIPLSAVLSLSAARDAYSDEYGLEGRRGVGVQSRLSAVYTADAFSLQREIRLGQVQERPRVLHPLIVNGLTQPDAARGFALALACGQVVVQRPRGREPQIYLRGTPLGDRLLLEVTQTRLALLVQAYLAIGEVLSAAEQAQLVEAYRVDNSLLPIWQSWLDGGWRSDENTDDPAQVDLLALCRVLVSEYS